jgi:hypothetical protein
VIRKAATVDIPRIMEIRACVRENMLRDLRGLRPETLAGSSTTRDGNLVF